MGATRRRNLEQLYSGPQVLEVPLYSLFEASPYLQIQENTLLGRRTLVPIAVRRELPIRAGHSTRRFV